MRIDRLLVYLRFARTRSKALELIEASRMRINGEHVLRSSMETKAGDVLTFAQGNQIRIIEILELPKRRNSAEKARSHYRELDRSGETAIASSNTSEYKEDPAP